MVEVTFPQCEGELNTGAHVALQECDTVVPVVLRLTPGATFTAKNKGHMYSLIDPKVLDCKSDLKVVQEIAISVLAKAGLQIDPNGGRFILVTVPIRAKRRHCVLVLHCSMMC